MYEAKRTGRDRVVEGARSPKQQHQAVDFVP